jgi:hypothetical protein
LWAVAKGGLEKTSGLERLEGSEAEGALGGKSEGHDGDLRSISRCGSWSSVGKSLRCCCAHAVVSIAVTHSGLWLSSGLPRVEIYRNMGCRNCVKLSMHIELPYVCEVTMMLVFKLSHYNHTHGLAPPVINSRPPNEPIVKDDTVS